MEQTAFKIKQITLNFDVERTVPNWMETGKTPEGFKFSKAIQLEHNTLHRKSMRGFYLTEFDSRETCLKEMCIQHQ